LVASTAFVPVRIFEFSNSMDVNQRASTLGASTRWHQ
jgi:hypothetical protein